MWTERFGRYKAQLVDTVFCVCQGSIVCLNEAIFAGIDENISYKLEMFLILNIVQICQQYCPFLG